MEIARGGTSNNWRQWCWYVEVLGHFDPPPRAELLAGLQSPTWSIRRTAAYVLGGFQPRSAEVALALVGALGDSNPAVREAVGSSLSSYVPIPLEAQPQITAALNCPVRLIVRHYLIHALMRIGPDALPGLRASLRSPDEAVRRGVLLAIGLMDGRTNTVPDLIACLDDPSPGLRRDASRLLGFMGAAGRPAIPPPDRRDPRPVRGRPPTRP